VARQTIDPLYRAIIVSRNPVVDVIDEICGAMKTDGAGVIITEVMKYKLSGQDAEVRIVSPMLKWLHILFGEERLVEFHLRITRKSELHYEITTEVAERRTTMSKNAQELVGNAVSGVRIVYVVAKGRKQAWIHEANLPPFRNLYYVCRDDLEEEYMQFPGKKKTAACSVVVRRSNTVSFREFCTKFDAKQTFRAARSRGAFILNRARKNKRKRVNASCVRLFKVFQGMFRPMEASSAGLRCVPRYNKLKAILLRLGILDVATSSHVPLMLRGVLERGSLEYKRFCSISAAKSFGSNFLRSSKGMCKMRGRKVVVRGIRVGMCLNVLGIGLALKLLVKPQSWFVVVCRNQSSRKASSPLARQLITGFII